MSSQYFKAIIDYDNNCGSNDTKVLYVYENNTTDYMQIVDEEGNEPSLCGTDWYCEALSNVLILQDSDNPCSSTKIEECGWNGLPENIQKVFDYKFYRKNHPLKLKEYDEKSGIKIYRTPIPEGRNVEEWLEWGYQPFDYILEDNVKIYLTPPKVCPICGSTNVTEENFNNIHSAALAGSAGYDDVCKDCGYRHRNITMMS